MTNPAKASTTPADRSALDDISHRATASNIDRTMSQTFDIIYVEDEPSIRQNYTELLDEHGYRVLALGTTAEAYSAIETATARLYILDIALGPDRNAGYSICERVIQLDPKAKILFLSTNNLSTDSSFERSSGAIAHINKDGPLSMLLTEVKRAFT